MIWREHSEIKGHAMFSGSQYNWINYDADDMLSKYCSSYSTEVGTILHKYCADKINAGMKLSKTNKSDISFELLRNSIPKAVVSNTEIDRIFDIMQVYVNDAVGFHMRTEQLLVYSTRFYGTADAISYKNKLLRIHDFKSGVTPAHIEQLMIYASFFCLEYNFHPTDIDIELRLYQSPQVLVMQPDASDIVPIMDKIISFDKLLSSMEE